jgi:hypothetical protein
MDSALEELEVLGADVAASIAVIRNRMCPQWEPP